MIESDAQNNTAAQDEDAERSAVDTGVTAGQLIREAREQAGFHLPALAANLKVGVNKLEALEANDWSVFPDVVFTRALASAVCRVLKIDAAPVLDKLPKAPGQDLRKAGEGINTRIAGGAAPAKGGDFAGSKPFPWMAVVLLLVVATAAVLFYPQLSERWKKQAAPTVATRTGNVAGTSEAVDPVALGGTTNVGDADTAVGNAPANPASGVAPAGAAVAPVVAAPEAPAAPADVPVLKVTAKQDTWVQVKESAGNVVFEKTIKAGSEQDIVATPPLKVVVGNAPGAQILLRGEAFDLKKVTKGSTARFEVN